MTSLPMISVRELVLFPGGVCPLVVGREFTIAALKMALEKHDGRIVVTTQKFIEMNDQPTFEQIYKTGTVCKIPKSVEFPDGSMKVVLEAEAKFEVTSIDDRNGVRYCEGHSGVAADVKGTLTLKDKMDVMAKIQSSKEDWKRDIDPWLNKLNSAKEDSAFVMGLGTLLSLRPNLSRELTLQQIKEGIFFVDTLSAEEQKTLNLGTARMQEILETSSVEGAFKKILALL